MTRPTRLARAAHLTADIRLGALLGILGGCLAAWMLAPADGPASAPRAAITEGKLSDRLTFVGDETETLVRETRIYDTLAMFALPLADARTWSETTTVAPERATEAGIRPAAPRPGAAPRMVTAEASAARRIAELPPVRPVRVAVTPTLAPAAPSDGRASPEGRTPIQVLGWTLPGTEYIPTRRDAVKTVGAIGGRAVAIGAGTAHVVTETAVAVGDGVSSLGGVIAETVGLR